MRLTPRMLVFRPVTTRQWPDMQKLFGPNGADGGCWCMWWRIKRAEFDRNHGEANRLAMEAIIRGGQVPGLLAYLEGEPVGWCSVAPRDAFPVLDRSPVLKRIDNRPVWSIVCFYVARKYRRCGLSGLLIQAAVEYARSRGGKIVEAYPVDPRAGKVDSGGAFTGLIDTFRKAGFTEAARRSKRRVIMRLPLS
jgi:GNAT superfamily N-acetyltransferase